MDLVDKIMRYEDGLMTEDEIAMLFQELVDNGLAWSLQGHYGRMAMALIEAGEVIDTHNIRGLDLGKVDCE